MCLGKVGVVMKVWEDDGVPMALVDVQSTSETVCLLSSPEAGVGTSVLVHLGFVVEILDPESAKEAKRLRTEAISKEEGP